MIRPIRLAFVLLITPLLVGCGDSTEPAGPLSGAWEITWQGTSGDGVTCGDSHSTLELTQRGTRLEGSINTVWVRTCSTGNGGPIVVVSSSVAELSSGTIDGSAVAFTTVHSQLPSFQADYAVQTAEITGQAEQNTMTGSVKWTMIRRSDNDFVLFTGLFEATKVP